MGRAALRGTYSEALLSLERPSRLQDIERLASGLPSLSIERLSSGLGSMHMVSAFCELVVHALVKGRLWLLASWSCALLPIILAERPLAKLATPLQAGQLCLPAALTCMRAFPMRVCLPPSFRLPSAPSAAPTIQTWPAWPAVRCPRMRTQQHWRALPAGRCPRTRTQQLLPA